MLPLVYFPEVNIIGFSISTYHLMHSLSYAAAGIFILLEAARLRLNLDRVFAVALWGFVGAVVGARLGGILRNWDYFVVHPEHIFNFAVGGWTEAGGFILSFVLMLAAVRHWRLPVLRVLDALAPALALRFAVSRFGCFAVHDHLGKLMSYPWPWGFDTPSGVRHETGFYSLVSNFMIFGVLWFWRKRIKTPGRLFVIYLFLYSISVFIIRFFRAVDLPYVSDERYWGLTATQYITLAVLGVALYLWRRPRAIELDKPKKL